VQITSVDVFAYVVNYVHGEYVMFGGRATPTQDGTLCGFAQTTTRRDGAR